MTTEPVAVNVSVPSIAGAIVGQGDSFFSVAQKVAGIPESERCPECGGTGSAPASTLTIPTCPACKGTGRK
jgi:hypothetical protein